MGSARRNATRHQSRVTCGLWLAVLALACTHVARAADDPLEDYKLAVGFYNKEQWKLAAQSFQSFLKNNGLHPKAEIANFYYGLALVKLDEFKQAREVLRNFVKDYPKSRDVAAAGYWIGHASYFLDDFAQAETRTKPLRGRRAQDPLLEWAAWPTWPMPNCVRRSPEAAAQATFSRQSRRFPREKWRTTHARSMARSYELLKKLPEAIRAAIRMWPATSRQPAPTRRSSAWAGCIFEAGDLRRRSQRFPKLSVEQRFPESLQLPHAQLNQGFALYQMRDFQKAAAQFDKAAKTEKYAAEATLWKGLSQKSLADIPQAAAVFKAAYEKYRDQPIAEKLLFQWAVCEERRGDRDQARTLFLEVIDRWPKGSLADESLHAACLAAVDSGKLPEADTLLARFDRDFPLNRLRMRQEILKGRVAAARNEFSDAAKHYQTVVATSEIESTKQQARYYLGHALQKLSNHAQVLDVTEPLASQIRADKTLSDYAPVYVLRGVSQLALAKAAAAKAKPGEESPEAAALCAATVESAKKYREAAPQGALSARALSIATIAEALARKKNESVANLTQLRTSSVAVGQVGEALYELGTIAFSKGDFGFAEQLFGELAAWPKESRFHSQALADLGWSQQRQKKHAEAAASFARVLAEHPDDTLVPEAAFMRGKALEEAGKIAEAQAAFAEAAQRPGTIEETYLAGLQSARLLGRLKKPADADAAYDELLKRFPKRSDGDKVLDEWAGLHYDTGNFARADEIFRRLAAEYPASSLADNALLSLAESSFLAGKLDDARVKFTSLSKGPSADPTVQQKALYQLMRVEFEARRWEPLRKICDEALRRFPDGIYRNEIELRRAEADFNLADFKAALGRLQKLTALKNDPALKKAEWFPQAWVMLAETHWRLKAYDAVAATVAEYKAWDPHSPLLYQAEEVLGRSFKSQAKFPRERVAFARVIKDPAAKLSETAAKSQLLIAETYFMQGDYETAAKEYATVEILYKYPDYQSPALFMAGECYRELKQWKTAAKIFSDLLRDYPKSKEAVQARERLDEVRKRQASG